MSLTTRIVIGMVLGFVTGSFLHAGLDPASATYDNVVGGVLHVGGQIFLSALKMLIVPLVFVSLVSGVNQLTDTSGLGRIGGKAIGLFMITTAMAVTLALTVALILLPGAGSVAEQTVVYTPPPAPDAAQVIIDIVPSNPFAAMAKGDMLQVIVFSLLFGIALVLSGDAGQRIRTLFNDLNAVILRLVSMIMELAPFGVFFLMAKLFAELGWDRIFALGDYFFTVAGVLVLHVVLTYSAILLLVTRVNPLRFFSKLRELWLFAFTTSSSAATLPVTLRTAEFRLGIHNEVAALTCPLGATINMDGTVIMQGVASVFIAQLYGIPLDLADYGMIVGVATLASVGAAPVPSAGIVTLSMVLTQIGVPLDGIAIILGVDRLLDMLRTSVNVTGDLVVSSVVARTEGMLDDAAYKD